MRISAAFLPALARHADRDICIVVDVLRASTSLVTMLDRGCPAVAVTPDVASARALAAACSSRRREGREGREEDDGSSTRRHEDTKGHEESTTGRSGGMDARGARRWLCGEQGGLPPEGFEYGNSPVELADVDFGGREAVFCTSNGTVALHAVAKAPVVLVGALVNASAVARAACVLAVERNTDVTVVCAGRHAGAIFSLDDAFCAGAIVTALRLEAARRDLPIEPDDDATASYLLFRGAGADEDSPPMPAAALSVFARSASGRQLRQLGLGADVEHCAQVDISVTVPRLMVRGEELVIVPSPLPLP